MNSHLIQQDSNTVKFSDSACGPCICDPTAAGVATSNSESFSSVLGHHPHARKSLGHLNSVSYMFSTELTPPFDYSVRSNNTIKLYRMQS